MKNQIAPVRMENRTPRRLLVEIHSLESATYEITSTTNVSTRGARILTKTAWVPDQEVSLRSFSGNLSLRAHVVYCKPLPDRLFSIGLELLQPPKSWPAREPSVPSATH